MITKNMADDMEYSYYYEPAYAKISGYQCETMTQLLLKMEPLYKFSKPIKLMVWAMNTQPPHSRVCYFFKGNYVKTIKMVLLNEYLFNEKCDYCSNTPLHLTVMYGNLKDVQSLVESKAKLYARNHLNEQPLHIACNLGKIDIVEYLLEHGADPYASDYLGDTPFGIAVEKNYLDIVRIMHVKCGNNMPVRILPFYVRRMTYLHVAAMKGLEKMCELLLEKNVHLGCVFAMDPNKNLPLHLAIIYKHENVAQLLIKETLVDMQNRELKTPLQLAIENGFTDTVRIMLDHSPNTELKTKNGDSLLHLAVAHFQLKIGKLLLPFCYVNEEDFWGRTPLYWAILLNQCEFANQLLRYGASVERMLTPLRYAIAKGWRDMVTLLLKNGVSPNIRVSSGSLLHDAAKQDDLYITSLLIYKGANINAVDKNQRSVLTWAVIHNSFNVAHYLIKRKADISLKDRYNNTALYYAIKSKHNYIIKYLLNEQRKNKQVT